MSDKEKPGIRPPPESVSLETAEKLRKKGFKVVVEDGKVRIVPPRSSSQGGVGEIIPFPKRRRP